MPIPIRPMKENERDYNGLAMDYSFLATVKLESESNKKIVEASNMEADSIVEIWTKGEKISENTYNIAKSNIDKGNISRLKAKGLISSKGDEISFTNRGKSIITTMALGESNAFLKVQNKKSYKEIMASMSKKNESGYRIPKFASDNSNNLNLGE